MHGPLPHPPPLRPSSPFYYVALVISPSYASVNNCGSKVVQWTENGQCLRLRPYRNRECIYLPSCLAHLCAILCLATVEIVCKQRLHKTLVYRLAIYQVLSAMEFSIIWIIEFINRLPHFYSLKVVVVLNAVLMGSSFHQADVHRLD